MIDNEISLQINLAPVDYPFASYLLQHQLSKLSSHVDEVLLTLDLHKSKGRFSGTDWDENCELIFKLIEEMRHQYLNVKVLEVDYSITSQEILADFFADNRFKIPFKDNRGGPYYSYLFGLLSTKNDFVFHLDSDILLMGDSVPWLAESVALLEENKEYLVSCPASSPVSPAKEYKNKLNKKNGHDYENFTTRFFLMDKRRIRHQFRRKLPPFDRIVNALIKGNPIYQAPERSLERFMKKHNLKRIEFPGSGGFIALHPATRDPLFFKALPKLISCVDKMEYPSDQEGISDITEEFLQFAVKA